MSSITNMKFEVDSDVIVSGIINGEIQARMCCKAQNPNNSENYRKELQRYKDAGIVNSTPSVVGFIKKYPSVFKNQKLISLRNGNIFEEMITLAPQTSQAEYDEKLKTRMIIGHELTEEEMVGMDEFCRDFHSLQTQEDLQKIISETREYKSSIERLWKSNGESIIEHIENILGYKPEHVGTVRTFIMYPNYDTHRSCQVSGTDTSLFLGKRGKDSENKVLAHLAHQAIHQPMLPYKMSMSKQDKEKLHSFIKFLTDKEIYGILSGESSLKINTPQEDHVLMGKIYPYWLGYKHRNDKIKGLDPIAEIQKEIQKDKEYYDSLPEGSKSKKNYKNYKFETLEPTKIAGFFRYKKGMTPYDFIKIDFDNRENISKTEKVLEERV